MSSQVVLIVEDDAGTAELERRSLRRAGIECRVVSRVKDALSAMTQQPFSAVLVDYQLPDGDAWSVVEAARTLAPPLPVVLVTAAGNEDLVVEAIRRGVADYVRKVEAFCDQLPLVIDRVTRLAEAERQLRARDAIFQLISAHGSDLILVRSADGRIASASPASLAILGYAPEELLGRSFADLIVDAAAPASSSEQAPQRELLRARHKTGRYVWLESNNYVQTPTLTGARELVAVMRDVTERVTAQEQLTRERVRLAEAQRTAQLGSWEWDIASNEIEWSDELYRIFGKERSSFGASYEEYLQALHPDDRQMVNDVVQAAFTAGTPFHTLHRVVWPNGEVRTVEGRGQVTRDADGNVTRMSGTAQDVTMRELQQAERDALLGRLEELNADLTASLREREVLLQEIHHRVKNNLQVITSLINLQMRKLEQGENREALLECQGRIQAIALIHEKLYQSTDYSRIPFAEYAKSLASSVFRVGQTSSGQVELAFALEEVPLAVDRAIPCGLILNELLTNALKHAFVGGRSGTIRVELARQGADGIRLVVADDGRGLPPGFDVGKSPTLGLQLVATLAAQLDGKVYASAGPGARFELGFPAQN